jgi:hypothetical protein
MEPIVAVEGEVHREPLGLQAALHRARETPFVFHHQHSHGHSLAPWA